MRSEQQQRPWYQNASVKKANQIFLRIVVPGFGVMWAFRILNAISRPGLFIWQLDIFTWLEVLALLLAIVGEFASLSLLIKGGWQIARERQESNGEWERVAQ